MNWELLLRAVWTKGLAFSFLIVRSQKYFQSSHVADVLKVPFEFMICKDERFLLVFRSNQLNYLRLHFSRPLGI